MLAHFYITELSINEIALSRAPVISNNPDFHRFEYFYGCLNSIKSWFDVLFKIPPADYIGFPFPIFSQIAQCLITLFKLSMLDDPGWDRKMVQNTANVLLILDQLSHSLLQVPSCAGLESDPIEGDVFTRTAKVSESIRQVWEAKLAVEPVGHDIAISQNVLEAVPDVAPTMNFSDDTWMSDILVSLNW